MIPSSTQSVSGVSLALLFAGILVLGVLAAPVAAAPCCSTCDQEDLDDPCWNWCLFSCYADSAEDQVVSSVDTNETSACAGAATVISSSVEEPVAPLAAIEASTAETASR